MITTANANTANAYTTTPSPSPSPLPTPTPTPTLATPPTPSPMSSPLSNHISTQQGGVCIHLAVFVKVSCFRHNEEVPNVGTSSCAVLFIFDTVGRYPPPCCVVLHF